MVLEKFFWFVQNEAVINSILANDLQKEGSLIKNVVKGIHPSRSFIYSTFQDITVPTQRKYPKGENANEATLTAPVNNTHARQNGVHTGYQNTK